jgi:hypothetical protein
MARDAWLERYFNALQLRKQGPETGTGWLAGCCRLHAKRAAGGNRDCIAIASVGTGIRP